MLDTTFFRDCEAAAERWDVQALALGSDTRYESTTFGLGCPPHARFPVASVTKPMTAALALQLLDLDASTAVWPEDVRVRHLLAHTAGFASELADLERFGDGDGALEAVVKELPSLDRPFGVDEVWSYANSGYWLAGWLSAQAAGASFEDTVARHVFEPAGMADSGFDAEGYPKARRASGGVVSNVPDLLAFARWLLDRPFFDAMRTVRGKPVAGVYGLGLFGRRIAGVDVWGHPGSYQTAKGSLLVVPARAAMFVALATGSKGDRALRLLEELWLERLLGERAARPAHVELSPAQFAAFAGSYANQQSEATVTVDGARLRVDFLDLVSGERTLREAHPIGPVTFEVCGGDFDGERFDFPREGFARFGSRLCRRVE